MGSFFPPRNLNFSPQPTKLSVSASLSRQFSETTWLFPLINLLPIWLDHYPGSINRGQLSLPPSITPDWPPPRRPSVTHYRNSWAVMVADSSFFLFCKISLFFFPFCRPRKDIRPRLEDQIALISLNGCQFISCVSVPRRGKRWIGPGDGVGQCCQYCYF